MNPNWIKEESKKLLRFIETSTDKELNEALKKANFKIQMNLQLTTIGSFKEARDLIDALNKLNDKRLACRITRRIHNYYRKSFSLIWTTPIIPDEYIKKVQNLFVITSILGRVSKNAEEANIPYLYFAVVCRLHQLKISSDRYLQTKIKMV